VTVRFISAERPPVNVLEAALLYAERFGWVTFPVPRGTKKSYKSAAHSNGQRWGATNKPEVLKRDYLRWPNANIGIPTGAENGFFVVETDTIEGGHGADGAVNLKKLALRHGRLPETLMAISPSGSVHRYFRWPRGCTVRNSASSIAPGIDVRGEGGMVVGPPSVKPGLARPYYVWLNWGIPIARAPQWLLDLVASKKRRARKPEAAGSDVVNIDLIEAALRAIPNPDLGWEDWNRVGMAIFVATGGEGFQLFDDWSAKSRKYNPFYTEDKWERFTRCPPRDIGVGTIFFLASRAQINWRTIYEAELWAR
jgi:hypothetical protein